MKWKWENIFRVYILLLLGILLWSAWHASAQNKQEAAAPEKVSTNRSAAASTNVTLSMPHWVENLAADHPFLKRQFWGNELWKYIFSLIYIFLAFYISKFLDYLMRVWLKKWAVKTKTQFDDLILELLNGPIKVIAFMVFLRIGIEVFRWPPVVQKFLAKAFTIIIAAAITYIALKFIDLILNYWRKRARPEADRTFDEQLFPIISKSLKVFVVVVAALVTLDNIGVNITAAIASLSIGGLAVGLAAQDTLANLFGAIALFGDKPFRIGDNIKLDENIQGVVETVGLRSSRLRHPEGFLIAVPNKTMGNASIININRRPTIRTEMNIGLTYDTPAEKIRLALKIVKEIYGDNPNTQSLLVGFNKFTDSALNIWVLHWWKGNDYGSYLAGIQELHLKLKERFDAEKIQFAFPTRTLFLKQDSDWRIGGEPLVPKKE